MAVKTYKDVLDAFTCNIGLERRHNHPINSLEAFRFKMMSDEVKKKVNSLFAYREFLMNLKNTAVMN